MGEHMFVETTALRHLSVVEDAEDSDTDLESSGGFSSGNMTNNFPPIDYPNSDPTSGGGDHLSAGDMSQSYPSADYKKPVPKPRSPGKTPPVPSPPPPVVPLTSPTSPTPSPCHMALTPPPAVPESLPHEPGSPVVKVPAPPYIPAPPPLPFKLMTDSRKSRTKAFHWDLVGSEKVTV